MKCQKCKTELLNLNHDDLFYCKKCKLNYKKIEFTDWEQSFAEEERMLSNGDGFY